MSRREPYEALPSSGPLAGLTVLELGENVAAPYCAKLLGDLGAKVIKVERPDGGDASRRHGPFPADEPDPERSATFLYLNTSKRSLRLDLRAQEDREAFAALAARVDILIEDRAAGELGAIGLGYAALARNNPKLIVTSITAFGQNGPNCLHRSHHLNLYHGAGHTSPFAALSANESRAPSRAGGSLGEYDAGLTAALGTLAAVLGRDRSGAGQHIDVSKQEAMMCLERVTIGRSANEPNPFAGGARGGLTRAADGWVMLTTLEIHQWEGLLRAMGNPAWANAAWCKTPAARMEHVEEIEARKNEWAATRTREEIYHAAQREGTPAAPVRDVAELLAWKQPRSRGFFRDLEFPKAGRLTVPTAGYRFSKTPWVGRPAPLLGEHDDEIRAELVSDHTRAAALSSDQTNDAGRKGPLSGIRIVDFTWAWAGPQGSLLLGMLGAEVIKIESRARLDHSRVHSLTAGRLQGGIDESPVFNDLNLGKHSLTLNLRTEQGRELVRELVAKSDVVLQNMRPGVLDRLGLGYDDLAATRQGLIMCSSSAVGATGPEGSYAGYAPTFACLSGMASISGHPDEPPIVLGGSVDLRVGTACAFAVLAALIHRGRTGEGQNIDLSSTEVMSSMMGDVILGYQLSGRVPGRIGNRDERMAPHGCYRCRSEDVSKETQEPGGWITIAVETDSEWTAFRSLLDDPLLESADFASAEARKRNEDRLDACVEAWTGKRGAAEAVTALQGAGVAAARLQTGASLARDPHVLARGVFERIVHPLLGELKVVRPPWRIEGARIHKPSPLLGQHNDSVLRGILGLDADEIERLEASEIVY